MINPPDDTLVLDVHGLKTFFGDVCVLKDIDFSVRKGEVMAIVGGSGSGKSTLLRSILLLLKPAAGTIRLFGKDFQNCSTEEEIQLRQKWGMMFQHGALFSSLTVLENIAFPLHEYTDLDNNMIAEIALLKLMLVGLPLESAHRYPSELSGGMQKRAAIARALALDPALVFLDEPTAGLDPHSASGLDELVLNLKSMLNLTLVMVTHDLDTLWRVADRVAFLGEGKVLAVGTMKQLSVMEHPLIKAYFSSPRAQAAYQREV